MNQSALKQTIRSYARVW